MSISRFHNIILLIFLICLSGCARDYDYKKWESLGKDVDSVNSALDTLYHSGELASHGRPALERLESIARTGSDDKVKARMYYWNALMALKSRPDSVAIILSKAEQCMKSGPDTYTAARISLLKAHVMPASAEKYKKIKACIAYFRSAEDEYMLLTAYSYLSYLYLEINDNENFKRCVDEVGSLYMKLGADSMALKNKMNYGLYYMSEGDSVKAGHVFRSLLGNPQIKRDSVLMGMLYANMACLENNPGYFQKAIEISPKYRKDIFARGTLQLAMARMYGKAGDIYKRDSILNMLEPLILSHGDAEAKRFFYEIQSVRSESSGNYRESVSLLKKSNLYRDSLHTDEIRNKITKLRHIDEKRNISNEHRQEKELFYAALAIISAIALVILAGFIVYFRRSIGRMIVNKLNTDRQIEKLNTSLEEEKRKKIAIGIRITEHDHLHDEMMELMKSLNSEGKLSSEGQRILSNKIKLSKETGKDLDDFRIVYETVHPAFMKRFTSKYPDVSEGDIRLALYIAIGLTNKQIAGVMHIQSDSVKKSRYRLRQRMHLTTGESLEAIMRDMLYADEGTSVPPDNPATP